MDDNPGLKIIEMVMKPKQRFVTRLDGFGSHREFMPEEYLLQADAIEKNMFFSEDGWYFIAEFNQVEIEIGTKEETIEEKQ